MSRIIGRIQSSPTSVNHQDQSIIERPQQKRLSNLTESHLNL